jgi:hypothetical protein
MTQLERIPRPAAKIAPTAVDAHPDQVAASGWRWGPKFDGGDWIIEDRTRTPWAFPVVEDPETETREPNAFARVLEDFIWELEHPAIVDALLEADPTTRSFARREPPAVMPDSIADAMADLNQQAKRELG